MLHPRAGPPGASNRPPDTATAVSASDTLGSANRRSIAVATAAIAITASANPPPAASGITGSASTAASHTVNTDRTASARSANLAASRARLRRASQLGLGHRAVGPSRENLFRMRASVENLHV